MSCWGIYACDCSTTARCCPATFPFCYHRAAGGQLRLIWGTGGCNSCESESRATQVVSIRSNRWFEFRAGFSQKFSRLLLSLRQLVIGRPVSLGWRNSRKEGKIEHLNKLRRAKLRSDFVTEVKIWGAADAKMGHPWFCCPLPYKSHLCCKMETINHPFMCVLQPHQKCPPNVNS